MLISFNSDDIRREFAKIIGEQLKKEVEQGDVKICFDEQDSIYVEYRVKD